jgi:enoyl-CoA hydratase/3-hydroxyacyl-CoA dehydrogenase
MDQDRKLYPTMFNPLLLKPSRPLPREMAVIGAGTIGPDIGYYLKTALPGTALHLVDISEKALKQAQERLKGYSKKAVDRRKMKPEQAEAVLKNINYTSDYSAIKNADLVIEAATEDLPLKQKIFAQVESIVNQDAIITSNTSSIPAGRIFGAMQKPERATVTHFFTPAWRSLPVEVIDWDKADRAVVDYLCWFFAHTGKVPMMTADAICFMLDRVFVNWCNESVYLLDGASAAQIDKVAEEFVFAGPFFVLNLTNGNPINVEAGTLLMEEGAHYEPPSILGSVHRWQIPRPGSKVEVPDDLKQKVRDRQLGTLFSQSFDIVDRQIGTKSDLNFGCQVALGFRQGSLDVMTKLGESEVSRIMAEFAKARPGFPQPKEDLSFYLDFKRHILVDDMDGVRIITIRRPQAMNALNDQVTGEILSVLKEFVDDPAVKGFVITGYGMQAFSAGAEIGKFTSVLGDAEAAVEYAHECAEVQVFMDQMQKPVVAAVNGIALGGGMEVAIRCHSIVASPRARFGLPEITLGILPGIGGSVVPYRKWPKGAGLFNQMICLGKQLSAQEAAEAGMVSQVVEGYSELIAAAVAEVDKLSGNLPRIQDEPVDIPSIEIPDPPMCGKLQLSREAVGITKETVEAAAAASSLAQALEIGYQGFGRIACTEAAKEGISAFMQKRPPKYEK